MRGRTRALLRVRSHWLESGDSEPVARSRPHDVREKRPAGQGFGQAEIQPGGVAERIGNSNSAGVGAGSQEAVDPLARRLVRIDLPVHMVERRRGR